MWRKYKLFILAGAMLIALGVLESIKPKEILWIESYSKYDKIPYGNFVLFKQLPFIFPNQPISTSNTAVSYLGDTLLNTNLIVINNEFHLEEDELNALMEYVHRGNQALIVSNNISVNLLDTLELEFVSDMIKDGEKFDWVMLNEDTTRYYFPNKNIFFQNYFDTSSHAQSLGYRSDSLINFIRKDVGRGKIYLHLQPGLFTNASMLEENHKYISDVLSFLPLQPTLWDEHYKVRKKYIQESALKEVLKVDGLRESLYLTLVGVLLFMVFGSKRKQRIIPILEPKSNTTVEFIETMGQLYYNEGDHKDIGFKQLNYFLTDIRDRYRIDTTVLDKHFCQRLSDLSGVDKGDVDKLVSIMNVIKLKKSSLEELIIEQDKWIQNYYYKENTYGK